MSWQEKPAYEQASWHWWQLSYAKYVTATRMQNVNGGL